MQRDGLSAAAALQFVKTAYKRLAANNIIWSMQHKTVVRPSLARRAVNKARYLLLLPYNRSKDRVYKYYGELAPLIDLVKKHD
jgi:hypothetical protein